MLKSSRKLILKLAVVILLATGVCITQNNVSAKSWCPICPDNWHCNFVTGDCVCDCPDAGGGCPMSCA